MSTRPQAGPALTAPLTHDELEALRAKAVEENRVYLNNELPYMRELIDSIIQRLMLNRDHIAGISISVVAIDGTALVHPDGKVCDGFAASNSLSQVYQNHLNVQVRENLKPGGRGVQRSDSLANLMRAIGRG